MHACMSVVLQADTVCDNIAIDMHIAVNGYSTRCVNNHRVVLFEFYVGGRLSIQKSTNIKTI